MQQYEGVNAFSDMCWVIKAGIVWKARGKGNTMNFLLTKNSALNVFHLFLWNLVVDSDVMEELFCEIISS